MEPDKTSGLNVRQRIIYSQLPKSGFNLRTIKVTPDIVAILLCIFGISSAATAKGYTKRMTQELLRTGSVQELAEFSDDLFECADAMLFCCVFRNFVRQIQIPRGAYQYERL